MIEFSAEKVLLLHQLLTQETGGDPELRDIGLLDSALKTNSMTNKVKLVKVENRAHIDGMAAMLDAMTVRQKYYSEIGEQLKNAR